MSFSRECLLHFPFPVKLWLAAETQCIAAVFWNESGNMVYIDLYQLERYLRSTASIFNVRRCEEFMLHLMAFNFQRMTSISVITPGFKNKNFRREDANALKFMSVEGYNLSFPLPRKALGFPLWEELKHNGMVPYQLLDFGDFDFMFKNFENYILQLKSFMVTLLQHDEALEQLDVTYIPEVHSLIYCNHLHSIIIPALWYPNQQVLLAGNQLKPSSESNDLLALESPENVEFSIKRNDKRGLDVPEEELVQTIRDATALPAINLEKYLNKNERNSENCKCIHKTCNNAGAYTLGTKTANTLTILNLWRSKESSEKTLSKSSKNSSHCSENSINFSDKPIMINSFPARSEEKLNEIGRLLPLCNLSWKRCSTTNCSCVCNQRSLN